MGTIKTKRQKKINKDLPSFSGESQVFVANFDFFVGGQWYVLGEDAFEGVLPILFEPGIPNVIFWGERHHVFIKFWNAR